MGWGGQCAAYLCHKNVRATVDVCGGKAQKPESRIDEQILTTVVLDKSVAMVAAVVLENQPRRGVVEVDPTNEPTVAIAKIRLDLGPWQSGLNQQPSQARFHRRFRGRRQHGESSQPVCTRATARRAGVASQRTPIRETQADRHVHGDQGLDRRPLNAEIAERAEKRCCTKASDNYRLGGRDCAPARAESGP
jgi:hypothetical protein